MLKIEHKEWSKENVFIDLAEGEPYAETMSLARRIAMNAAVQFGGKIISLVLGLITVGLLQRALQPEGFGAYTIIMSYLGFFSVVADFGLYLILVRELNKPGADRDRVFANILGIRLLTFFSVFIIALGILPFFHYQSGVNHGVLIGTVGFLAVAVTQLLVSIFQTTLTMRRVAIAELLGRVTLLVGVFLAVQAGAGVATMVAAVVCANVVNLAYLLARSRTFVRVRVAYDPAFWRYVLRETAPIALSVVLNLIYFRIDAIILSLFRTTQEVGLYGSAYKVLELLNTFPIMFVGLLLPVLTQAFAQDREHFIRLYQRSFDVLVMGVLPIIVGGWFLARPILTFIGGAGFQDAAPVFRLLLFAVGCLYLNCLSGNAVTIINKQRQMVWGYLAVALVGLGVYFSLIPGLGMYGAAIGTIITEGLMALIGLFVVVRTVRFRIRLPALGKALLAAVAMAVVLWLVPGSSLFIEVPLGAVVYAAALLLTRGVPVAFLRELLKRDAISDTQPVL